MDVTVNRRRIRWEQRTASSFTSPKRPKFGRAGQPNLTIYAEIMHSALARFDVTINLSHINQMYASTAVPEGGKRTRRARDCGTLFATKRWRLNGNGDLNPAGLVLYPNHHARTGRNSVCYVNGRMVIGTPDQSKRSPSVRRHLADQQPLCCMGDR